MASAPSEKRMKLIRDLHDVVEHRKGAKLVRDLSQDHSDELSDLCGAELKPYGSLLHHAAGLGDVEVLNVVLESGIDVNIAQMDSHVTQGQTPLHIAALAGKHNIVEELLSRGADVNARESEGLTPLHCACSGNDVRTVELLLKGGAAVNALDHKGQSPLQRSILRSSNDITNLIIQNGADIHIKDAGGQSVLHYAVEWDNEELVSYFLRAGIQANLQDNEGCSPLHLAENEDIMQMLIQNGGDVRLRDNSGRPVVSEQLDMEKEEYQRINDLLQKQLKAPEVTSPSDDTVAHIQEKINQMVLPSGEDNETTHSGLMAELVGKTKKA